GLVLAALARAPARRASALSARHGGRRVEAVGRARRGRRRVRARARRKPPDAPAGPAARAGALRLAFGPAPRVGCARRLAGPRDRRLRGGGRLLPEPLRRGGSRGRSARAPARRALAP